MWEQLVTMAVENGVIAALFTGLLVYVLKDSAKREKKYCELNSKLLENLSIVKQIRKDVTEIRRDINKPEPHQRHRDRHD